MFVDTAAALDPNAVAMRAKDLTRPMTRPGELAAAWRRAGLVDVEETSLQIRMEFSSFADFWAPFLGKEGPGCEYVGSLGGEFYKLDAAHGIKAKRDVGVNWPGDAAEDVALGDERRKVARDAGSSGGLSMLQHVRQTRMHADARHLTAMRADPASAIERSQEAQQITGAGEHGLGVRQERLAGRGQPDSAAVPDEQRLGQLRFQAVDLLADRGLRDRDPLSRTGEVAFLGDRQEVRQLPQFHTQSLSL
jgi:hypothetical protein